MKFFIAIFSILIVQFSWAQDFEKMSDDFLSEVVIGDSINLRTLPQKPIEIDSLELFEHINYEKHSLMEIAMLDSIQSFLDTASIQDKAQLLKQIENNNEFQWKNLSPKQFVIFKEKKEGKGSTNYSLPIFYSTNKAMIYHSWYFGSHYAGMSIDFWEFKDGKWTKLKSETLWMS